MAALGLLPFLASAFGITTTQTLLDLTDRNHPALRLLEEEAPGTFNHSLMVGSLAGKAARSVGGNPLLAQAMAYFHDLGKTVSPQYYVENQFGVSNPHDRLPPEHSAAVVRSHVAEGLRLSRELRHPARRGPGHRHPPRHQPHALLLPPGAGDLRRGPGGSRPTTATAAASRPPRRWWW